MQFSQKLHIKYIRVFAICKTASYAMKRNFTRLGALRLGEVIGQAIEAQGWTQLELVGKLAQLGHISSEWAISRLVGGKNDKPDAMLVLTIADMEFVKNPSTGEPYSFRELMLIACEAIDPITGELLPNHKN